MRAGRQGRPPRARGGAEGGERLALARAEESSKVLGENEVASADVFLVVDEPLSLGGAARYWRAVVMEFARAHFRHPAWGFSHSTRDYALATELAAADRVTLDDDVLFAAAYLQDMAAFAPWKKESVDHADEAANIVQTVLEGTNFPMAKLDAVRGAIRTHMYAREPVGNEALYLHDADALDWLGAIGVARIIALVHPNGGAPDGPAAVKMLEENLAEVPARVLSPAGRARVAQRKQELEAFLDALRLESRELQDLWRGVRHVVLNRSSGSIYFHSQRSCSVSSRTRSPFP